MTDIERAVRRGAAVLDHFYPDWEFRTDPKSLDLRDCSRCVLGQMFTGKASGFFEPYKWGTTEIFAARWHDAYGYDFRQEVDCGFSRKTYKPEEWNALRDAWVALIAERRAVPEVAEVHS